MVSLLKAWLLDPVALLFIISLLLIFILGKRRHARRSRSSRAGTHRVRGFWPLLLFWGGLFLICSAPVIVNPLIAMLEDPYVELPACESGSHLVVLGGGVDSRASSANEFERMSPATLARASAAARIALAEPTLKVIAAGGAVNKISESQVIAAYLEQLGVSGERIIQESRSASTRENAINSLALLAEESVRGPVRLVTSAMHMPRALQSFRRVMTAEGLDVCPVVGVDIQALKNVPPYALMPQTTAIARFEKLLHELVATQIYRRNGWI